MSYAQVKRSIDVVASAAGLVTLAPLMVSIAAAVKLTSPGPALFRQERVGRGRQPFELLKFRSMVTNLSTVQVTAGTDARITALGRILRATKLDELPQLWNVLRGDLSLVGPRPEIPRYAAHYPPEWNDIFSVRPGITDPACLRFPDEAAVLGVANNVEEAYRQILIPVKASLNLEYVRNVSLRLDARILVHTLWILSVGRVIRPPIDPLVQDTIRQIQEINNVG